MRRTRTIFGDWINEGDLVHHFLNDEPLTVLKIKRRLAWDTMSFQVIVHAVSASGKVRKDNADVFRPVVSNWLG